MLDPEADAAPFVARLEMRDRAFTQSRARLFFGDGVPATEGAAADVFAFCARAITQPARTWEATTTELGLGLLPLAANLETMFFGTEDAIAQATTRGA